MREMKAIIDLHCDTLLETYLRGEHLRDGNGHLNLEKMKATGAMAQCFAVFEATGAAAARREIADGPYELFQKVYEFYLKELSANSDLIASARTADEVEQNWKEGKLSSILTLEDCILLEGKLERVDELAEKGVRMAALTWNYENTVGYPNHGEDLEHMRGLKPFGIEAVERMNEVGIIVDVSHLSEGGFYDVAKYSRRPFAASHSCARALCDHSRNLTDGQLHRLGELGGVVGVNFYSGFLTEGSDYTENSQIAAHAAHIAKVAGIEAVALGSDFDGIDCGLEMGDYAGFPTLAEAFQQHFTDDQIDLIFYKNFLRVFRECAGLESRIG